MTIKSTRTIFLCILITAFTGAVFADDAQVVADAYPQRLISEFVVDYQEGGAAPLQLNDFKPLGTDLIVAAYTNGFTGAIRVLRRDGTVVAEPALKISGIFPTVNVVNLDNSGGDEVIVSFSSARGIDTNWVFRWTGTELQSIGPTAIDDDGSIYPTLLNAGWTDLDGNGTIDFYAPNTDPGGYDAPPPTPGFDVFKLSNGRYELAGTMVFAQTFDFERTTGKPVAATSTIDATPGAYELRVENDGVSSAVITVNGVDVVTPNMMKKKVVRLTVPLTLQASNTLTVELRGAPGGKLTVVIEPR